jgi:hypothetical protein
MPIGADETVLTEALAGRKKTCGRCGHENDRSGRNLQYVRLDAGLKAGSTRATSTLELP